jgi:ribosomal protein L19
MHDVDLKRQRKRERDKRYYLRELDGKKVADVEYDGATVDAQ